MKQEEKPQESKSDFTVCPECGGPLHFNEGCEICLHCGWSACEK